MVEFTFKEVGTKSPHMVAYFDELRSLGVTESDLCDIGILIGLKVAKAVEGGDDDKTFKDLSIEGQRQIMDYIIDGNDKDDMATQIAERMTSSEIKEIVRIFKDECDVIVK